MMPLETGRPRPETIGKHEYKPLQDMTQFFFACPRVEHAARGIQLQISGTGHYTSSDPKPLALND